MAKKSNKKTIKKPKIRKKVVDGNGVFLLCLQCEKDCKCSTIVKEPLGFGCRNYKKEVINNWSE